MIENQRIRRAVAVVTLLLLGMIVALTLWVINSSPNAPTYPKIDAVTTYNDGFTDGKADALGDDNRDGVIEEDEYGFNCHIHGNHKCGPDAPADGFVNH